LQLYNKGRNAVTYMICRAKTWFNTVCLVRESPPVWGSRADAIAYPTKGDAELIRRRLREETRAVDVNQEG
jgi:hypothetical protein